MIDERNLSGAFVDEKTDVELVELVRNGRKEAFAVLVSRYQTVTFRLARRLLKNDQAAQDLAQEALTQAYDSLASLRNPARFKSWLLGIALNIYRSQVRGNSPFPISLEAVLTTLHPDVADLAPGPEELVEERERSLSVLDTMNTLSQEDRDIIALFYYGQFSLQEIGTIMGTATGNVKVRLHRARRRFKTSLMRHHPELMLANKKEEAMVKVSIADVVRQKHFEKDNNRASSFVVVLMDEPGHRALPIWIGQPEAEAIAIGLTEFATPRPITLNFLAGLLDQINARVDEVRIETLKKTTFYAVVKVRSGKSTKEIDARPSDAIALAVRTGCPIYVAEDVLQNAGETIPADAKVPVVRKGIEDIVNEIEKQLEAMRKAVDRSAQQVNAARASVISEVFHRV